MKISLVMSHFLIFISAVSPLLSGAEEPLDIRFPNSPLFIDIVTADNGLQVIYKLCSSRPGSQILCQHEPVLQISASDLRTIRRCLSAKVANLEELHDAAFAATALGAGQVRSGGVTSVAATRSSINAMNALLGFFPEIGQDFTVRDRTPEEFVREVPQKFRQAQRECANELRESARQAPRDGTTPRTSPRQPESRQRSGR